VLVVVPALIAAGCGSSSKSSTKPSTAANKPAATTPPTPQTPSTGTGTSMSVGMTGPNNVPLNSPALKTALTAQFAKDSRIPAKFDAPLADCLLKKLEGNGYKTVGDAKAHPSVIRADALACAKQLTGQ
jgi:hypothetical protein